MLRRVRRDDRGQHTSVCFCDACATVTNCDTSHRVAAARHHALSRSLGACPL